MSDCNSTCDFCVACRGRRLFAIILVATGSTWRILCIICSFCLIRSSNLLLCRARFHILIVSSISTTRSLWLIGCWTLSIIVGGWTDCTSICRFVSATYWLRIVTCLTIWQCIWWLGGGTTIFLFSIHSDCIYCIIMVGLSDFLSPIMNIILYRNINFYSKICSI